MSGYAILTATEIEAGSYSCKVVVDIAGDTGYRAEVSKNATATLNGCKTFAMQVVSALDPGGATVGSRRVKVKSLDAETDLD